ncbi:MAG TPA: multicopper oxidase domain-containing protein [Longimicrobiales bacterium]
MRAAAALARVAVLPLLALLPSATPLPGTLPARALPEVLANPNLERAGVLRDGVLTVALEAKKTRWHMDGTRSPPTIISAFSEAGRPPVAPGPLLRVPVGTELHISVRNSLQVPLRFLVPASLAGGPNEIRAVDSVVVAAGEVGTLRVRAAVPGNYVYRATTVPPGPDVPADIGGLLAGGVVVDGPGPTPRDRVFVILETNLSKQDGQLVGNTGRFIYTINGLSWPRTERIRASVGDSLHWRVINASADRHPMHLHGFYYRVDALSGALPDGPAPGAGQMVVTQLLTGLGGMTLTWSPDRPGNWLFHCHLGLHVMPDSASAAPDDPHMRGMAGLVIGTLVRGRAEKSLAAPSAPARRLRLVAVAPPGGTAQEPRMRFVLEEDGRRIDTGTHISPELDLTRGRPVAVTIVNHLDEPTSIHWHGIEIQASYMDGVPGFSGEGRQLTPAIAPGDSFVARFTPTRSGTFMYHAHVDDVREQDAGLLGALVVGEPGAAPSPDDHVFFLKSARLDQQLPVEINGRSDPDTVVLHAGRPARLRLLNLSNHHLSEFPVVLLTSAADTGAEHAESSLMRWQPLAKDGFDLPATARTPGPARHIVAIGETYDVEYTPLQAGVLYLQYRLALPGSPRPGRLLIRVPIRVEN